jgi:UDP-2,4-diacetamido-2,4,6-trideoxy-beta-L-altropyranose hydrolase
MGTGHVMRCLALAQAWQDVGGRALFAMAQTTSAVCDRLRAESCETLSMSAMTGTLDDCVQTATVAREHGAEWIVLDGYHFGADYQQRLKAAGFKFLVVDDYGHAERYYADLVLNQNAGVHEELYRNREAHTKLLLGPQYWMLRREFVSWRDWQREIAPAGRRVLVMMGGSDPQNLTGVVIEALGGVGIDGLEVLVLVGGSNPQFESLQEATTRCKEKVTLRSDVTNVAEWMAWADMAISAAGSTCGELCLLGLPALIVDVAENQTALAQELDHKGCAIRLGSGGEITAPLIVEHLRQALESAETRARLSHRCRALVDGYGARRVVASLHGETLWLRSAQGSDARLLWEWVNDPDVRRASFSSDAIPWEQHKSWFAGKMKDTNCRILIAENREAIPVGQFRVDWRSNLDGEIDVSLARSYRQGGLGKRLIDLGATRVLAERPTARLHALIKVENDASRRAFEAAGFHLLGEERVQGQPAMHYVRTAESRVQGADDVVEGN